MDMMQGPLSQLLFTPSVQLSHFVAGADLRRPSNPVQRRAIREILPLLFANA
jgi:hypothetical protein